MERLVESTQAFLVVLREHRAVELASYAAMQDLLSEAKIAFDRDDRGSAIARLEVLLSTIHKLILEYAPQDSFMPQAKGARPYRPSGTEASLHHDKPERPSVLIVDDSEMDTARLVGLLEGDLDVMVANSVATARVALVEKEFDLVVTDLLLGPSRSDGREVILSAKSSSKRTKVVLFTMYSLLSEMADLTSLGVDAVFVKSAVLSEPREGQQMIDRLIQLAVDARRQRGPSVPR